MSLFGDHTDGVPVKISERYKPPPRIELSRGIAESEARARRALAAADYGFAFEGRVLAKLAELRAAKETIASERRHRLRLLEEAEQRRLDRLAAVEAEDRLRQLSVAGVSYPSAEELGGAGPPAPPPAAPAPVAPALLQPERLPARRRDLLADPDPLEDLHLYSADSRYSYDRRNVDKLTFSDFENDSSNPFDNMELKSINDMDLLAQVLQNQKSDEESETHTSYCATPSRLSSAALTEPYPAVAYVEQPIVGHSNPVYSPPQHYTLPDPYYVNSENACDNNNMYNPGYEYYAQGAFNSQPPNGYYVQPASHAPPLAAAPPYGYYPYPQVSLGYTAPYDAASGSCEGQRSCTEESRGIIKSRSRSVPDIVKELSDEVASERQRADERWTATPEPAGGPRGCSERRRRRSEAAPDPLTALPPDSQDMCRNIGSMGFPLDRVARICALLGNNHKKVVEGLLLVGQLMELGFSESRVAAALANHHFNRDKALEELIA